MRGVSGENRTPIVTMRVVYSHLTGPPVSDTCAGYSPIPANGWAGYVSQATELIINVSQPVTGGG